MGKVGWSVALLLAMGCGEESRSMDGTPAVDSGSPPVVDTDAGPGTTPASDGGTVTADAGTPPAGSSTTAPPEAIERLVGSFALETTFATISEVPFLGDQETLGRTWGLVEIVQVGDALEMTERGCHVASEGSMATIPDAVPRSIPPRAATLEFVTDDGALRWIRPETAVAVGWTPASPDDALPQSAADPRVTDPDGDGNPGVTVHVSGLATGDVYVVQWQRSWYEGELGGSGPIVGENHGGGSEQKTIGASTMLLEMEVPSRAAPDTTQNVVRLVPIGAGYDCDRLVAEADELF